MKYFRIKNYEKYQSHKRRGPEWIQLYCHLIYDAGYTQLHDSHKSHFVHMLLVASQNGNEFPCNSRLVRLQLQCRSYVKIQVFENLGLIEIFDKEKKTTKSGTPPLEREIDRKIERKKDSYAPVAHSRSSNSSKDGKKDTTQTYKAEQKWIALFIKEHGFKPEMSPAKDRTILKHLIKKHGFDLVMKKIEMHIYEDKLLTIGGFKIMFNDLNDEPFDPEEVVI